MSMTIWGIAKSSATLGLRSRTKQKAHCKYCGRECILSGLHHHERTCQGTTALNNEQNRCACGEWKPYPVPCCWRCCDRDERMLELDAILRDEGIINGKWWGRVLG